MKFYVSVLCSIFLAICPMKGANEVLSYRLNGGRVGNCLVTYIKTLYCSWKYNLPLLYVPFINSHLFWMHQENNDQLHLYNTEVDVYHEKELSSRKHNESSMVHFVNFYSILTNSSKVSIVDKNLQDRIFREIEMLYDYSVQMRDFRDELIQALSPKNTYNKITLPEGSITIAVHVRKGNGLDFPLKSRQVYTLSPDVKPTKHQFNGSYSDQRWPTMFVPDQYYIDQLQELATLLAKIPLYVHIFTDAKDPHALLQLYKKHVKGDNIVFACNTAPQNPVWDMWDIGEFDCLIRSSSTFAWAAQMMGEHKVIIKPVQSQWYGDILHVNKVEIIVPHCTQSRVDRYLVSGKRSIEVAEKIKETLYKPEQCDDDE